MSFNEGFTNQTDTTCRNEGFMDSNRGGIESYGQGTGSGVCASTSKLNLFTDMMLL